MDWSNIIVGGLALLGTTVGSLAGIRASNKVVDLRLRSLEEKVSKHNSLVERMTRVEGLAGRNEGRIKELEALHRRVDS